MLFQIQQRGDKIQKQKKALMYSIEANLPPKYMKKRIDTQIYSVGGFSTDASMKLRDLNSKKMNNGIAEVPYIEHYRRIHKPQLSEVERQKVDNITEINQYAKDKFKDRQAELDFYLKYNYNPFIAVKSKDSKQQFRNLVRRTAENIKIVDIVEVMGQKKDKMADLRPEQADMIAKRKAGLLEINLRSKKILQNALQSAKQDILMPSISSKDEQADTKIYLSKQQKQWLEVQNSDIDEIISWKQPNFYLQEEKKMNIFRLIDNDADQISPYDRLRKFSFQFNSVIEKSYKFRIPFFRDLSTMGRAIIASSYNGKQNVADHIFSHEITLNFSELRFIDILNVASNRFSPQFLYRNFYADDRERVQISDNSSEDIDEEEVIYRKETRNEKIKHKGNDEELQEIETYQRLSLNQNQQKFGEQMKQNIEQMLKVGKIKSFLTQNTIRDAGVHQELSQEMKEMIRKIIYPSKNVGDDYEKTVRFGKINSDRSGILKIKNLTNMMKDKYKFDKMERQLTRFSVRTQFKIR